LPQLIVDSCRFKIAMQQAHALTGLPWQGDALARLRGRH